MKALVLNNKVVQLSEAEFPVATGLSWVTCTSEAQVGFDVVEGAVVIPTVPTPTIEEAKATRLQELSAHRYSWETGGFNFFGQNIATDDRSKNLITGARIAADADPSYSINWKTNTGWTTLSAAQIIAISNAIRDFVQACFNREKYHFEQINLLTTVAAVNSYDITTGWP